MSTRVLSEKMIYGGRFSSLAILVLSSRSRSKSSSPLEFRISDLRSLVEAFLLPVPDAPSFSEVFFAFFKITCLTPPVTSSVRPVNRSSAYLSCVTVRMFSSKSRLMICLISLSGSSRRLPWHERAVTPYSRSLARSSPASIPAITLIPYRCFASRIPAMIFFAASVTSVSSYSRRQFRQFPQHPPPLSPK